MFMYSLLEGDQSVSQIRLSQVMRLRVDSSLAVFFFPSGVSVQSLKTDFD